MEFGKPVILICAYNEQDWIGKTLQQIISVLRESRTSAEIIVVNDGSTDRTKEVVESFGVRVINLSKNMGKTSAFFTGLRKALVGNPISIVTLDADMLAVPKDDLLKMINLTKDATEKKQTLMVVAEIRELPNTRTRTFSGVRAYSLPAAYTVIRSSNKKLPEGFGLELFLNKENYKTIITIETGFIQRAALEHPETRTRQIKELKKTRDRLEIRDVKRARKQIKQYRIQRKP